MKKKKPKMMWMVMARCGWDAIEFLGIKMAGTPKDGPQGFIPVFDSYEQAVAWRGDRTTEIVQIVEAK